MTLIKENTDSKNASVKEMVSEGSPVKLEGNRKNLKTIKESGADFARHAKEDGLHMAESVAAEGQQRLSELKSFASKHIQTLEKEIVANPIKSVAIALGAGVLLSIMLRRG